MDDGDVDRVDDSWVEVDELDRMVDTWQEVGGNAGCKQTSDRRVGVARCDGVVVGR